MLPPIWFRFLLLSALAFSLACLPFAWTEPPKGTSTDSQRGFKRPAPAAEAAKGKSYALLVGVRNYRGSGLAH